MKYYLNTIAAAAVAMAAAAPAFAGTQVIAQPGISLTEAAQVKFNRDTRQDDRHVAVTPVAPSGSYEQLAASAGLSPQEAKGKSLAEIFVAKINRESRTQDQQAVKGGAVTMASRSPAGNAGRGQLIASAGLSAEAAAGMSLSEIAAVKFNRDTATGDR